MTRATSAPSYAHLAALTDQTSIFEHAEYDVPRHAHGYCVDDAARALVLVTREPDTTPLMERLGEVYLSFLERALSEDGRMHNRMSEQRVFVDVPGVGDWWGRAVWAFGVVQAQSRSADHRARAARAFARAAGQRSADLRAMAFAAIGAAAVLQGEPENAQARSMLEDAASMIGAARCDSWTWPEASLRYANGILPEALLAAGAGLGRQDHIARGLELLRFLLSVESAGGHLSVTGTDGRAPGDDGPLFDQQPIEPAAIGEACARAFEVTADPAWLAGVESAWGWFAGRNDAGIAMFDASAGGGFDGLHRESRNENRGAESTIAALMTRQLARRFGVLD
ncbi:glycosyltransferase [Microbacterium sp.]|uniref:glycosyltransferase n=1 Tax=Microbacterium sp. TaxID=51671 RepID=UPI002E307E88|nr:glycosyltransferase [Microbacterium sp.]HEX5729453.1 glycosyltransferase [Microbacterium sp.]